MDVGPELLHDLVDLDAAIAGVEAGVAGVGLGGVEADFCKGSERTGGL